jgi:hypothetical protein
LELTMTSSPHKTTLKRQVESLFKSDPFQLAIPLISQVAWRLRPLPTKSYKLTWINMTKITLCQTSELTMISSLPRTTSRRPVENSHK